MKNLLYSFYLLLLALAVFTSCTKDDPEIIESEAVKSAYIINYGNFGSGGASITKYDSENDLIFNNYFETQNDGFELLSNIQYAGLYNDSIYLVGNSNDQLIVLDTLFKQTRNGISEDLANPRYFVGNGDCLYISCLGETPNWTTMPDSYIAVFDTKSGKVINTIDVPGGPEGLAIANQKLYVALNYVQKIAVIDLTDHSLNYIETPAVSSYFIKDKDENLYVSFVRSLSSETGLGYINTTSDKLDNTYLFDGISTSYGSILSANADFSKIYVLASAYDEDFNLSGSVQSFDVATGIFSSLITDIAGPTGVVTNPFDNNIYVLCAESVTEGGLLKIYAEDGVFKKEYNTGISPTMAVFLY